MHIENQIKQLWVKSDLLVYAQVSRAEIQLLAKYVEGMGHLGVVTTIDRFQGDVVIQTTKSCWPELRKLLLQLPLSINFVEDNDNI